MAEPPPTREALRVGGQEHERPGADALTILTVFVVVTLALPTRYTVAVMGGAGSLPTIVGLLALGAWAFLHISRVEPRVIVPQAPRRALFAFVALLLMSFVIAARRPGGGEELWYAQLSLLLVISWCGITLLASDFLTSWQSVEKLVERLGLGAGLYAVLGIVQYYSGEPLVNDLPIPLLARQTDIASITLREGLNRPSSTAIHAIEFGVTMAALLPFCLYVFQHSRHGLVRRAFPVAAVALAIPLSISRSAIVCVVAGLLVLAATWSWRVRRLALLATLVAGSVIYVSAPGVAGTMLGLFTGVRNDPSALSRTDSYSLTLEFIAQNPVFGRGFGTFLPKYRILDNQYLGLAVEVGLVGLAATLALFVVAAACLVRVARTTVEPVRRNISQAVLASTSSTAVGYAFFDGLSFQQYACITFLNLGIAGAVCRLHAAQRRLGQGAGPALNAE